MCVCGVCVCVCVCMEGGGSARLFLRGVPPGDTASLTIRIYPPSAHGSHPAGAIPTTWHCFPLAHAAEPLLSAHGAALDDDPPFVDLSAPAASAASAA